MVYQAGKDFYPCYNTIVTPGLERFTGRYKGRVERFSGQCGLDLIVTVDIENHWNIFHPQFEDPKTIDAIKRDLGSVKEPSKILGKEIFVYTSIFKTLGISIPGRKPKLV